MRRLIWGAVLVITGCSSATTLERSEAAAGGLGGAEPGSGGAGAAGMVATTGGSAGALGGSDSGGTGAAPVGGAQAGGSGGSVGGQAGAPAGGTAGSAGAPNHCVNALIDRDLGETALDCGGPDCPPCATGQACVVGDDCETRLCEGGLCAPTCTTDSQCGSSVCAPQLDAPTDACDATATDCACTECPELIAACNPAGVSDAPQCAEVLRCLLDANCGAFDDCYAATGSGRCYDVISGNGGPSTPAVQRARSLLEGCIVVACPMTCQQQVTPSTR